MANDHFVGTLGAPTISPIGNITDSFTGSPPSGSTSDPISAFDTIQKPASQMVGAFGLPDWFWNAAGTVVPGGNLPNIVGNLPGVPDITKPLNDTIKSTVAYVILIGLLLLGVLGIVLPAMGINVETVTDSAKKIGETAALA